MRTIDVSQATKLSRITALSYGQSRAGKTRFSGSWPRPLFLSDATESGWTTLANMDRSVLFETDRPPVVWAIETAADMKMALRDAEPMIRKGEILTVAIDSLTFYADLFFNFLDASGRVDQRQLYQKLAQHLKDLRIQVHQLGCNVVWLALEKSPGEDSPVGGPMLSGQNAQKFAAGCDYVFYHRSHQPTPISPVSWEIRTKRYQNYAAGGRDEGRLTDPLGFMSVDEETGEERFITDCTYRTVAECLGILSPGDGVDKLVNAMLAEQAVLAKISSGGAIAGATAVAAATAGAEAIATPTAIQAQQPQQQNGKRPAPPQTRR